MLKVVCDGCGKVLLVSPKKVREPDEVIETLGGKCRYCGKELVYDVDKITIDVNPDFTRHVF